MAVPKSKRSLIIRRSRRSALRLNNYYSIKQQSAFLNRIPQIPEKLFFNSIYAIFSLKLKYF